MIEINLDECLMKEAFNRTELVLEKDEVSKEIVISIKNQMIGARYCHTLHYPKAEFDEGTVQFRSAEAINPFCAVIRTP